MTYIIVASYEKLVEGKWKFQGKVKMDSLVNYFALLTDYYIDGNPHPPIAAGRSHPVDMDSETAKKFDYEDCAEISYFSFKEFFDYIAGAWKWTAYVKPEAWERYQKTGEPPRDNEFSWNPAFGQEEKRTWTVKLVDEFADFVIRMKDIVKQDDPESFRVIYIVYI